MRLDGKKVGKFRVTTVLATYDLDVRLNMESNVFVIHVPTAPDVAISTERDQRNHESFSAPTLNEVKKTAQEFLTSRDQTEFVDVIEYNYSGASEDRRSRFSSVNNFVGFDFRVARVSVVRDRSDRPKLEQPIEIDEQGRISVEIRYGEVCSPEAHRFNSLSSRIPFSIERWRKCCAIREGIEKLDKMLFELLGRDGDQCALRLDAIGLNPLMLTTGNPPDED